MKVRVIMADLAVDHSHLLSLLRCLLEPDVYAAEVLSQLTETGLLDPVLLLKKLILVILF
jgi:hypothetical protein